MTNDDNPVWHRMLYSCTHVATVNCKGLIARTARTRNSKEKSHSSQCRVRTARGGLSRMLGLQCLMWKTSSDNDEAWKTVPNRCCSCWEGHMIHLELIVAINKPCITGHELWRSDCQTMRESTSSTDRQDRTGQERTARSAAEEQSNRSPMTDRLHVQ